MSGTSRQRFSVRAGLTHATVDEAPYEGAPPHLVASLRDWLRQELNIDEIHFVDEDAARTLCLRLRIAAGTGRDAAFRLINSEDEELLDVVDALLAYRAENAVGPNTSSLNYLTRILEEGGSAYRINEAQDGLEVRVTPTIRDAVRQTVTSAAAVTAAGSAADHLATAWRAAYGRSPDPVLAYSEAVKAVECAAHAVVSPNSTRASLGTMARDIKNAPQKFTVAITAPSDPTAVVIAMMESLWRGQTRHGAQTTTVPETLEAARAGVHLAATLVHWFTSGAVARNP